MQKLRLQETLKFQRSVDRDIFVYYIAGGHEFMFNKQNAFYYPEGTYTTQNGSHKIT